MIVQGTNVPLAVTFDEDVSSIPTLVATLWLKDGSLIKQWEKIYKYAFIVQVN